MELLEFISDPARKTELAKACSTDPAWLWQIATKWEPTPGKPKRPSPELALCIERESERMGAKVRKETLRPDVWTDEQESS